VNQTINVKYWWSLTFIFIKEFNSRYHKNTLLLALYYANFKINMDIT